MPTRNKIILLVLAAAVIFYDTAATAGPTTYYDCEDAARKANYYDEGGVWRRFCNYLYVLKKKGYENATLYYGSCKELTLQSNQSKSCFCFNFFHDPYTP